MVYSWSKKIVVVATRYSSNTVQMFKSGYSFHTTTGERHNDLFAERVCLPGASNYGTMRVAGVGFVLKVDVLYTGPHQRFNYLNI